LQISTETGIGTANRQTQGWKAPRSPVRNGILTATLPRAGGRPTSQDQIAADHRVVAESVVALGRKESSDADNSNDHSVARGVVRSVQAWGTNAIVRAAGGSARTPE
jgi:hypothetical protein